MQQQGAINPAQYELLNVLSCINKEEDVAELKAVIVQFLNSRLQKEIDRLWDNGTLTEDKIEAWGEEHMRTPYKYGWNKFFVRRQCYLLGLFSLFQIPHSLQMVTRCNKHEVLMRSL